MNKVDKGRSCTTRFFCEFFLLSLNFTVFLKELAGFLFISHSFHCSFHFGQFTPRDWYGFDLLHALSHLNIFMHARMHACEYMLNRSIFLWMWNWTHEFWLCMSGRTCIRCYCYCCCCLFASTQKHPKISTRYLFYFIDISFRFVSLPFMLVNDAFQPISALC